jgi:hypothetical protein
MARSLNREAIQKKLPPIHTPESVAHIKNAYANLYSVAWDYLEQQMNRVIAQAIGTSGNSYYTHQGAYGYQVSPAGFRRRYLDPSLIKVILNQEGRKDSELMRTLKDMRREASNWQIQHGVAIYIMEACANWIEFRQRNPQVPIVMVDILHDSMRFLIHWSALGMAKELLPKIMLEIPSNVKPKLRVDMKITYEWNGEEIKIVQAEEVIKQYNQNMPAEAKLSVKEIVGKIAKTGASSEDELQACGLPQNLAARLVNDVFPNKTYFPHPDQPKIHIPGLKFLGLDQWNYVTP